MDGVDTLGDEAVADGAIAVVGRVNLVDALGDWEAGDADAGAGGVTLADGAPGAGRGDAADGADGGVSACGGGDADGTDGADDALVAIGAAAGALAAPPGAGAGAALPDRAVSALGFGSKGAHAATKRQHNVIAVRDTCSQLTIKSPRSADTWRRTPDLAR